MYAETQPKEGSCVFAESRRSRDEREIIRRCVAVGLPFVILSDGVPCGELGMYASYYAYSRIERHFAAIEGHGCNENAMPYTLS